MSVTWEDREGKLGTHIMAYRALATTAMILVVALRYLQTRALDRFEELIRFGVCRRLSPNNFF